MKSKTFCSTLESKEDKQVIMHRILVVLFIFPGFLFSQSSYLGIGNQSEHDIDRLDIINPVNVPIHTGIKPYSRKEVTTAAILSQNKNEALTSKDLDDLNYIFRDNNEWLDLDTSEYQLIGTGEYEKVYSDSTKIFYTIEENKNKVSAASVLKEENDQAILGYFYKTPANFYELETKYLKMKINPIINMRVGKNTEDDNLIFQNTRGLELRGNIDEKVYFYTSLLENQGRFNNFIERRILRYNAIPGFGNFKNFQSTVVDQVNGWDFPNSQAYVGVQVSKHIGVELGHGRHFIGHGYNSLLMSDYANNYFYLKFNTKVWKLHYQNIFAELNPISTRQNPGDVLLPKKYMATHYLSIKPKSNIEIGLFETVLFSRPNQFEFQYLNPVIFYRTVEFFLDSPDNVILGMDAKWNMLNRISLYGQFVLDEFKLSELRSGSGWWANKYGVQVGFKYINVLNIDHLDIQMEYNMVRPYTYSHRTPVDGFENTSIANYSHGNQPLAHPLGANFKEYIGILRYRPFPKVELMAKAMYADYGDSTDGFNWGNDILIPHGTRVMDLGNEVGQGVSNQVTSLSLDMSYEVFHNYFIDFNILYRKQDSTDNNYDLDTKYIGGGIRANIANAKLDY